MCTRSSALFAASVLLALTQASSARAFGDLFRFNDAAAHGGGGGRWFTGSPHDAYGCEVCHGGDLAPTPVAVHGLPLVYQPGASYDIQVQWPATALHTTAMFEITDALGHGAGTAAVPAPVAAAESCIPLDLQTAGGIVLSAPELPIAEARQLVGMQDCGASMLHWIWTAPATDVGPVMFAGGVVAPDMQRDEAGDRVTRVFKTIPSPTQANYETKLAASCAVRAPERHAASCWLSAIVFASCAVRLRRKRASH